MRSTWRRWPAADFQLVMSAARALAGTPDRAAAVSALLAALARLTALDSDPSRDPRMAILERLEELGSPEQAAALEPYLADTDSRVAAQAAKMIGGWTGRSVSAAPRPRAAQRDVLTEADVDRLARTTVRVTMEGGGQFEVKLLADLAPLSCARFASLVAQGYYNGLSFHRIIPNFMIQGGSPGANEYVGYSRYMRDEVGRVTQLRGTIGHLDPRPRYRRCTDLHQSRGFAPPRPRVPDLRGGHPRNGRGGRHPRRRRHVEGGTDQEVALIKPTTEATKSTEIPRRGLRRRPGFAGAAGGRLCGARTSTLRHTAGSCAPRPASRPGPGPGVEARVYVTLSRVTSMISVPSVCSVVQEMPTQPRGQVRDYRPRRWSVSTRNVTRLAPRSCQVGRRPVAARSRRNSMARRRFAVTRTRAAPARTVRRTRGHVAIA